MGTPRFRSRVLAAVGAATVLAGVTAIGPARAAEPSSGTVSADSPTTEWSGSFTLPGIVTPSGCAPEFCDTFALTVDLGDRPGDLTVEVTQTGQLSTPHVAIVDAAGEVLAQEFGAATAEGIASGEYAVQVTTGSLEPATTYTATATLTPKAGSFQPVADDIRYDHDDQGPVASVDVPLRVVMVGFEDGSVDAERVFAQIPDFQRVGSLYSYGGGIRGGDDALLLGNDTLINHGRAYYVEDEPFLLPLEYRWKPELHYAPSEMTRGLFEAMMATSTTGDYANPVLRAYLEAYNASRGSLYRVAASGDPGQAVAPGAPVRFVDGEDAEDWLAANVERYLGFTAGRDPGQPGYTVFVLNTWDSPEAEDVFPAGEYHVFKIDRTDPDRGEFDGIDWGRVWGGRYRSMIVDLGAAPNAYESETWGNRGRSALGSALADPPLWEYRAGAPRPVDGHRLVDGASNAGSALTPGATWDDDALHDVLARTVNEAANFRFFHSYLYEPRPGTGRFFLSDNVWQDATTVYDSDLEKLYDQEAALEGLRTLTPYFEFSGDVRYQYLDQVAEFPEYADDQAALDQAKNDGDDVAGAPHVSMRTDTMMDYIDSKPDRFLRGGACATTVPTIQVAVPGHYAWALPVAAGIATNRDGVPWGFLNSVNDVTKWNGADKDQTLVLAHPNVLFNGTFTYTTIHEASHYLGLAHPHDTIGAVRGEDGEPVYYDGFSWTFNTTAAPTTYSHVETAYSILDQESIARGHLAYYLQWAGEALEATGQALYDRGTTTTAGLHPWVAALRDISIRSIAEAETLFSSFRFVDATFAAQRAWLAAATYRDLALDLEPGTSQLEKGTQLGTNAEVDGASCPRPTATDPPRPPYQPGAAPRAEFAGTPAPVDRPGESARAPDGVALSGNRTAADRRAPGEGGGPPLAVAALAAVLIVGVLRALARHTTRA